MSSWQKSTYSGVEFREHISRRHGTRKDKYFSIRYYRDGKQTREALGWASEGWSAARAHKIRSDIRTNMKLGDGPCSVAEMRSQRKIREHESNAKELRFKDLAARYLDEARQNKSSWRHDETRLNLHILPLLGDKRLVDITRTDAELLKQTCIANGLADATTTQCLTLLRHVFRWAVSCDLYSGRIPTDGITWPTVSNRRVRYLTDSEEQEFFAYAVRYHQETADICMISLYAGLRMGEIFTLQKMDILNTGLLVRDGKNGTDRLVPIHKLVRECLDRAILRRDLTDPEGILFSGPDGSVRKEIPSQFRTVIRHLGWNEGIQDRRLKIVAHTFRHTFASRLVTRGVPLTVVQELMGHKTLEMTRRYVHSSAAQTAAAIHLL